MSALKWHIDCLAPSVYTDTSMCYGSRSNYVSPGQLNTTQYSQTAQGSNYTLAYEGYTDWLVPVVHTAILVAMGKGVLPVSVPAGSLPLQT